MPCPSCYDAGTAIPHVVDVQGHFQSLGIEVTVNCAGVIITTDVTHDILIIGGRYIVGVTSEPYILTVGGRYIGGRYIPTLHPNHTVPIGDKLPHRSQSIGLEILMR